MRRVSTLGLLVFGWLLAPSSARPDHLTIDLEVKAGQASKKPPSEIAGLGTKPKARGSLELKAGTSITVKWTLSNTAPKTTVKNVLVHFFVVKEEKAGQVAVPRLDKGVPAEAESALSMDFKPKDKTEGELSFTLDKPGVYLLRLETIGAAIGLDGHEHFAALDLVVK